jgi:hypothetical protein
MKWPSDDKEFLYGWFVIAISLFRKLGKHSANVSWLSDHVFIARIHTLDKRKMIAGRSSGISFFFSEKKRITENLRIHWSIFFRCTVGRSKKRIRVRHGARKICVHEDLERKWGLFVWAKVERSPFTWKSETDDAQSRMQFISCGMCLQERWNLFCYCNINRLKPSGKYMYHLLNTKKCQHFSHIVYSIRFSGKRAIISLNSVNWSVLVTETTSCR